MFKIVKGGARTFKAEVKFRMPNDSGTTDTMSFMAKFQMLTTDELQAAEEMRPIDFVRKVLVGWEGIQDGAGQDLPFSDDNKDAVLQEPIVVFNMARTYHDTVKKGLPQAKN